MNEKGKTDAIVRQLRRVLFRWEIAERDWHGVISSENEIKPSLPYLDNHHLTGDLYDVTFPSGLADLSLTTTPASDSIQPGDLVYSDGIPVGVASNAYGRAVTIYLNDISLEPLHHYPSGMFPPGLSEVSVGALVSVDYPRIASGVMLAPIGYTIGDSATDFTHSLPAYPTVSGQVTLYPVWEDDE